MEDFDAIETCYDSGSKSQDAAGNWKRVHSLVNSPNEVRPFRAKLLRLYFDEFCTAARMAVCGNGLKLVFMLLPERIIFFLFFQGRFPHPI